MEAFLGLILFALFTASSGTLILIAVEQSGKDAWYGLANVLTLDKGKLSVKMVKTEVDKVSSDNTPDPFIWNRAMESKFQFFPDETTIMNATSLKEMAVNNNWIKAKMAVPKCTLQLSGEVSLGPVGKEIRFYGYPTAGDGVLLVMSPNVYNDSKTLFEDMNNTYNVVKDNAVVKSKTKVFVEWILETGGDKSKTLLLINFDGVIEVDKKVQGGVDTQDGLSSKCYVMFISRKFTHYGLGNIDFKQENAKGMLQIGQIWNPKKKNYVKVAEEHIGVLKDALTFTIVPRDVVKQDDPNGLWRVLHFPLVMSPIANTTLELLAEKIGVPFDLGKAGTVEYEYNGTQTLPVYYDQTSKMLTFVGREVIDKFDKFRIATKAINDVKDDNENDVKMKLFDFHNSISKLFGNISVSDSLSPHDSVQNAFQNVLLQYNYHVL